MPNGVVIFHLKRLWAGPDGLIDLYEEIKAGRKNSEWREARPYWWSRLFKKADGKNILKVKRAWFVIGYPKHNLPRLEADIKRVIFHVFQGYFEIQFENVIEVKEAGSSIPAYC